MPKYSYKADRYAETMTVYEDNKTLCVAGDVTRAKAVNQKKLFYDIVYELRGVKLN